MFSGGIELKYWLKMGKSNAKTFLGPSQTSR